MQQLSKFFIIVDRAKSSTRQCLRDYIFYLYVFVLKLRESFLKSLKITWNGECKIPIELPDTY